MKHQHELLLIVGIWFSGLKTQGGTGWPLWDYRGDSGTGGLLGEDFSHRNSCGRGPVIVTTGSSAQDVAHTEGFTRYGLLLTSTSSGCATPVGAKATPPVPPCVGDWSSGKGHLGRLPQAIDGIRIEFRIRVDDGNALDDGLTDDQTVEGVFVVWWERQPR